MILNPSWLLELNDLAILNLHVTHQVSAQSDLLFGRRCGLKNFKMAAMAALEQNDFSKSEFP